MEQVEKKAITINDVARRAGVSQATASRAFGGRGYASAEVKEKVLRAARELDLLTTPYAFDPEQAAKLTDAGADIIVAHMGLTTSGTIGAQTAKTLDESVAAVGAIADAAKSRREDVLILCHGGPIAMPDDAQYVFDRAKGVDGFYGASSMERLPTETAITEQVRDFSALELT